MLDIPGFQAWRIDCVSADLVIVVAEASVAIDRVSVLLMLEGCNCRLAKLSFSCSIIIMVALHQEFGRTLDASLSAPIASERHPTPFEAIALSAERRLTVAVIWRFPLMVMMTLAGGVLVVFLKVPKNWVPQALRDIQFRPLLQIIKWVSSRVPSLDFFS